MSRTGAIGSSFEREWQRLMREIAIDLSEEFDKNFERKSFFGSPWRRRIISGRGSLLVASGRLRRSLRHSVTARYISWSSDAPYAKIHNEGGEIEVTAKMRGWFWYMYSMTKLPIYKALGCKKVGDKIHIPQRQYIGDHRRVRQVIEQDAREWIDDQLQRIARENNRGLRGI